MKHQVRVLVLLMFTSAMVAAYGAVGVQPKNVQKENSATRSKRLTLETFSVFPPEAEGCSCYFSADAKAFKQKQWICVNDYGALYFLKINGKMVKFTETGRKKINQATTLIKAAGSGYELTIEVKDGAATGEETWRKTGVITVKERAGQALVRTFFGECGC